MTGTAILNADILDIIFENRNKGYGAYMLRKGYNSRLLKALAGTFLLIAIASLAASFTKKKQGSGRLDITTEMYNIPAAPKNDIPKEQEPEKPKPREQNLVKTQKHTTPVITNNPDEADKLPDDLEHSAIGTQNIEGTEKPIVQAVPVEKPTPVADPAPAEKPVDVVTPMETAEVAPAFPGGMSELYRFLQKNLSNPEDLEEGQMISVKIKFIVGYNGELKGFEVVQDGGRAFNDEVIRVLRKMPKWIPGKTKGQNVSVYYTLPVRFVAAG